MRTARWLIPLVLSPAAAQAGPDTITGQLSLRANHHSAAVHVSYSGDDNANVTGTLSVREKGAGAWTPAHPLVRAKTYSDAAAGPRLSGVVLWLQPGKEYEIRAAVADPDGASVKELVGSVTTRSEPAAPAATTYYVSTTGDDSAPGTQAAPLASIQAGAAKLGPGVTVLIAPGVYRETVNITKSGAEGKWARLAASGPGVVLDGSDESLAAGASGFTKGSGAGWSRAAPAGLTSRYGYLDGHRLFPYDTASALGALAADTAAAASLSKGYYGPSLGGFVIEGGKLHVAPRDGADPNGKPLAIPKYDNGLRVLGAHHLIVEGLEIRHFGVAATGEAIELVDASDVVLRGNTVHGAPQAISARKSTRLLIEKNSVHDDLSYGLDWGGTYGAYANSFAHNQGISIQGSYEDNVVRANQVRGFVDGIVVGSGTGQRCENFDIYENDVSESRDDAIELDCDDINGKVWGNYLHENHSAFSISGCEAGPLFVLGNVAHRYFNESFKLHPHATQGPVFIYNNTLHSGWGALDPNTGRGLEIEMLAGMSYVSPEYVRFENNVLSASNWVRYDNGSPPKPDSYYFDYNCWHTTHASRFIRSAGQEHASLSAYSAASGMEKHGVQGDPGFVDPKAGDLHLAPASPCRAKGRAIDGVTASSSPDMGAYFEGGSGVGPGGQSGGGGGPSSGGGSNSGGTGNAGATAGSGGGQAADSGSDDGGCGCRAAGERTRFPWSLALLAALAAVHSLGRRAARRRGSF